MSDSASAPPVVADPQDPLPESNWAYRRVLTFLVLAWVGATVMLGVAFIANLGKVEPEAAIRGMVTVIIWKEVFALVVVSLYLVAPSAEQFGKIAQAVSAMKAGVSFTTTARATSAEGQAETVTKAGKPDSEK